MFLFSIFNFPLALQHTTTNKYSATHNMLALILTLYLKWNSADLTIFHFQWLELQMRQMDKCEKIKRSCVLLLLFGFSLQQCKVSFSSFNRMQIANWKWGHFNCLQISKVNPEGKATFQYKQIHTEKKRNNRCTLPFGYTALIIKCTYIMFLSIYLQMICDIHESIQSV